MRALVVIGHNVYPWQDIMLALGRAGTETAWLRVASLPAAAGQSFDIVLLDHHGAEAFRTSDMRARLVVAVQMDSIPYEFPFLRPLFDDLARSGRAQVAYWTACAHSRRFITRHAPSLPLFHARYPMLPGRVFLPPEAQLIAPGDIDRYLAASEDWLQPMRAGIGELAGRLVYAGTCEDFSTAAADWPENGPVARLELDGIARSTCDDGRRPLNKLDALARVMAARALSLDAQGLALKGYYQYLVKFQSVHERARMARLLNDRVGERLCLIGDDWARHGLPHRPSTFGSAVDVSAYYAPAAGALDFGSSQLDTGWYQRPMEIVKHGGRLLQYRRYDSDELFGSLAGDLVFEDDAGLMSMVERVLDPAHAERERALRSAVSDRMAADCDPATIGAAALDLFEKWMAGGTGAAAAAPLSATDELAEARRLLEQGGIDRAAELCTALLQREPRHAGAIHVLGRIALQLGQHEQALDLLRAAAALDGRNPTHLLSYGALLQDLGRAAEAVGPLRLAARLADDLTEAHVRLSAALLPGEPYHDVLKRMHERLKPPVYVEIGVMYGESLAHARPPTRAIGVDPKPDIQVEFAAPTQIFPMTSDAFFERESFEAAAGAARFDLAFIDGMHTFDQTLRDFINLEKRAHAGSVVLIHDCLPLDAATSTRKQRTVFWSGDTWKVIPVLRRWRPDLEVRVIATRPTGLAVIGRLDPTSTVLESAWDEIVATTMPLGFDFLAEGRDGKLGLMANDWVEIERHLAHLTAA